LRLGSQPRTDGVEQAGALELAAADIEPSTM
jgi:hypothetical protein